METQHAKSGGSNRCGRTRGPRPDPARVAAVRERLYSEGQTIAGWAAEHGETPVQVSKVLSGNRACMTGESHRIAVKLGLKDGALAPVTRA